MTLLARRLTRQASVRRLRLRAVGLVVCALATVGMGASQPAAAQNSRQAAEQLPSPDFSAPEIDPAPPVVDPGAIRIPIGRQPDANAVRLTSNGNRITLVVRDASLGDVLALLAQERKLNIVFSDTLDTRVSITLKDALLEDVLTSILSVAGYRWAETRGIIHITAVDQENLPAHVQGRQLRVYTLDYTAAADMLQAVQGFLSPIGNAYIQESSPVDNRRTKEALVVEDLPDVLQRAEEYIGQVDQPPRQVLIQVHVLQVDLKDDLKHGVNLDAILNLANTPIQLETVGFANANAPTSTFLSLQETDLSALVQLLQTTTDAKTIASPRVLCLNGQESRIQVGEQLGFRVTTTTQTSTLESVEFLDLGVVLRVTPRISRDNQVMIQIKPSVSSGRVNPLTGLPEEETTEVDTNVLLHSGQAIVIGGLIKETDHDIQSKVPKLGDAWRVGKLFQRRELLKDRSEVIIALVPYILPYGECNAMRNCQEVNQASTPLLVGPLVRVPRPWEPRLPSAYERPQRLPPVDGYCDAVTGSMIAPPYECVVPQFPGPPGEAIPAGELLEDAQPSAAPTAVEGRRRFGSRVSRFLRPDVRR